MSDKEESKREQIDFEVSIKQGDKTLQNKRMFLIQIDPFLLDFIPDEDFDRWFNLLELYFNGLLRKAFHDRGLKYWQEKS